MAKSVVQSERDSISPEARDYLTTQLTRTERHVLARAALVAAEDNDDIILPSHIEAAWGEVLGKRSYKKWLGVAIPVSAILGGMCQTLFSGAGKAVGAYIMHLLQISS